jgi:LysM repeat protein
MKGISQLFLGMLTAVGSSALILAAASLALIEGSFAVGMVQSPTLEPATITAPPGSTPQPTQPPDINQTTAQPTPCPFPADWVEYSVLPGDTLESLANETGLSVEQIYSLNCLDSTYIMAGMVLRLPIGAPTSTVPPALPTAPPPLPTTIRCGPYQGWVIYIVQPGDNLFRLSLAFGVNVSTLQFANCLTNDSIYAGQRLYVPNVPTRTPRPTNIVPPTSTSLPSATPVTPTIAPTIETPTPVVETPVAETPVPDTDTPEPVTDTPVAEPETAEPPAAETIEENSALTETPDPIKP